MNAEFHNEDFRAFLGRYPATHARISSVWRERRGKHSRKPAGLRAMIEQAWPAAKRVELFAREVPAGWDVWGNDPAVAALAAKTGVE